MTDNADRVAYKIQAEQGWTDATLGELAFAFACGTTPDEFLSYLRQIQATENEHLGE